MKIYFSMLLILISITSYASPGWSQDQPSVNSKEELKDFQIKVREIIMKNRYYPKEAKEKKLAGTVKLVFVINREGKVISCELSQSSGIIILDEAALETVKTSSPFPKIPNSLDLDEIKFCLPICFETVI
jgi:periplasmic protein TonB